MIKLSLSRAAVAVGALALSLTAGAGIASADPDLDPIVNTTCTEGQVTAALNAANPSVAKRFNSDPQQLAALRMFLASPPDQRLQFAQQLASAPGNAPYVPTLQKVFNTCNNF
jgi:hemophore-related protein